MLRNMKTVVELFLSNNNWEGKPWKFMEQLDAGKTCRYIFVVVTKWLHNIATSNSKP